MTSKDEIKPMEVDFDGIMTELGKIGKYQLIHFSWTIIPIILCSVHANNYIFTAAETNYRCFVEGCDTPGGEYNPGWLTNAIPQNDKCNTYKMLLPPNKTTLNDQTCPVQFDHQTKVKCDKYVFEKEHSFIEEMDIPCVSWKRTLIGTLHSAGTLLALPIIGFVSDRWGRRFMLVVAGVTEGLLGIIKGLSVNYPMFAAMEIIEPTLGSGVFTSGYILALELLIPTTRVAGGTAINVLFATGQVCMGAIAWLVPYYRTYLYVIYAPSLLLFVFWWILDESTRWLLSKGRYVEALANVTKIANTNKMALPEKQLEPLRFNVEHIDDFKNTKMENDVPELGKKDELTPFQQVIRSKILLLRVLRCSFWWITCTFCFYGMSLNAVALAGNLHLNFILAACCEIPGHICAYFGLIYFGRKKTIFTAYLIAGICLISFVFIPDNLRWLSMLCFLLGKACVAGSFSSIYLYTSELFPTPLRHTLLATCSMVGRIGSILAPQTPLLTYYLDAFPSILFASTCLISALLMLNSPETLGINLPETVQEAEDISKLRKNKK